MLSIGNEQIHIEVKHAKDRREFYWSDLQYEKARELEGNDEKYFMAVLYPNEDQSYGIYWIWNPLDELRGVSRHVQWAGQSEYQPVEADTWAVKMLRPSQVPTKHYKFRIRLNKEFVEGLDKDTEALDTLRRKIAAQ